MKDQEGGGRGGGRQSFFHGKLKNGYDFPLKLRGSSENLFTFQKGIKSIIRKFERAPSHFFPESERNYDTYLSLRLFLAIIKCLRTLT